MKKIRKWLCVVLTVFLVFFGIPVTPGQFSFTTTELTTNAVTALPYTSKSLSSQGICGIIKEIK